jgi:hypothetical protein
MPTWLFYLLLILPNVMALTWHSDIRNWRKMTKLFQERTRSIAEGFDIIEDLVDDMIRTDPSIEESLQIAKLEIKKIQRQLQLEIEFFEPSIIKKTRALRKMRRHMKEES